MTDANNQCDITTNDIWREVWGDKPAPDAAHAHIRQVLCRCAADITHECGTPESTLRAYANTVREFLRYEGECAADRCGTCANADRRNGLYCHVLGLYGFTTPGDDWWCGYWRPS